MTLGGELVFTPPGFVRPYVDLWGAWQIVNIQENKIPSGSDLGSVVTWDDTKGKQAQATFGCTVGVRAELPFHLLADVFWRMNFRGLLAATVGVGVGGYL
jgi:hypothetical protein